MNNLLERKEIIEIKKTLTHLINLGADLFINSEWFLGYSEDMLASVYKQLKLKIVCPVKLIHHSSKIFSLEYSDGTVQTIHSTMQGSRMIKAYFETRPVQHLCAALKLNQTKLKRLRDKK